VVATFSLRLLSDVLITGCVCLILLRKRQQAMSECVRAKQRVGPMLTSPQEQIPSRQPRKLQFGHRSNHWYVRRPTHS
jgi:hypothetical protein